MLKRIYFFVVALVSTSAFAAQELPNILWITSEDNGPELGCYGDSYAVTPHLDGLARKSLRYLNAWSTAPVCAPARTTIISGIYPPATGSEHMRSSSILPASFKMYPQILREAGYYTSNNSKEDYNLEKQGVVWDDSSNKGHWRNRPAGKPFFSIFNYTISHESKIRNEIDDQDRIHDPSLAPVPAYQPDTPEVRKDWAQYYDRITMMDAEVGQTLKELEEDGLTDSTIIFYYGDHGSGMPRSKRWPYNSGLSVPLIVHVPQKYRHLAPLGYRPNGTSDRLVGFIDLAPTLLSIIGQKPLEWMQGHAFMGEFEEAEQEFAFGFRGRMDERYDLVRTTRDKRYIYLRQYMPQKIYGQYINYMFQTPTTAQWKRLHDLGQLNEVQSRFWEPKPAEELYDLRNDPDEVHNLANSPAHRHILERLRAAHKAHEAEIRDVGFLPEGELHSRAQGSTPYEVGHDPDRYPFEEIFAMADLAAGREASAIPALREGLYHTDSAVRYWAAMGLLIRGEAGATAAREDLRRALGDESPYVRIQAAQALGQFGNEADANVALPVLLAAANPERTNIYSAMMALNSLDELDDKAYAFKDQIAALPRHAPDEDRRMRAYVGNLIDKIVQDLGGAR